MDTDKLAALAAGAIGLDETDFIGREIADADTPAQAIKRMESVISDAETAINVIKNEVARG